MATFLERVTVVCFAASYLVALALEVWRMFRPRPIQRLVAVGFGLAGLVAHVAYLVVQSVPITTSVGSLLFLSLILAIVYVYGSVHHPQIVWGPFVLPIALTLIVVAVGLGLNDATQAIEPQWSRAWGISHAMLVILAAAGMCIGFLASLMYLVQTYRLRAKLPPGQGLKLLNLERLELMHRRAVLWSFPLLTTGLIIGMALQIQSGEFLLGWDSPRIASGLVLWGVFAILLYLRYRAHVRGHQVALLTLLAFALLLFVLASPQHPFPRGEAP